MRPATKDARPSLAIDIISCKWIDITGGNLSVLYSFDRTFRSDAYFFLSVLTSSWVRGLYHKSMGEYA